MKKTIKEQNAALIILLSNVFIAFLGIGLIIPVMPSFMDIMHLSGKTMGYLVAVFAVAQLLMSPLAGRWVDRYGRKKMIIIGLFLFGISELIFGLGTNVLMLYISRILGGISAAFIMPGVTAYVADITSIQERPRAMGYISAAISTGFIIGPGIGGFIAEYGVRMPFFFAAAVAFLACLSSIFILKEPLTKEQLAEISANTKQTNFISDLKRSLNSLYFIAFIIVFVLAFGLSAYETVFSLFSDHKFGFTPKDIATIITISSIFGVVVQVFMFGKMVDILGEKKLIQLCLITGAILAVASTVISSFLAVLVVTCFIFLAFDLLRPALTTFLSKAAGKEQGFVAGMNSTYTSLGNIVGPAMGGILFDVNIHYPYLFAAVIMVIGLGITVMWQEKQFAERLAE
ncbi:MFS transporter [Aneurinibacillus aneurinilyticus]|jgi:DHA1 family multidrug resistance protein-like MFS transporter|uniref:MFS transporter n=2 Tax=Aneurinibacillus aneurinilyticus TaxID=1391 RepID=A0A848CS28_ANEAE|nr:MFS transporter [Aneurinibacillus aneurinilyticus]ERI10381.1 multidrug resistance protein 2 [Aneurinibacillus aneurinilyticus ATCC 12856]MCI1696146.1 MFS transporter [Aneurinibacillus aneurinilyticus]MED0671703.1 MFS transporter [Aneurinibacillus aneurinilyticus]MED0705096.1 MFS transporter [Aneurinibacillus aneurinilyticus]MED0724261.1 MFS transporter [Aneurinibacillus aneurinilyticus]